MWNELLYALDEQGNRYFFDVLETADGMLLTLKKEIFRTARQLRLLPSLSRAEAGAEGYYIMPRSLGMPGEPQIFFTPREDAALRYEKPVMSWYGIKKEGLCALIRVERNYYYQYEVTLENGVYTACPLLDLTQRDTPYDDIPLELIRLPEGGDYNTMARTERTLRMARGELVTLAEKCQNPATEYARKYPVVRIRMGWKPSPSPVLIQTEATEPEMFVACTFARVREIADELKRQGVEGAELQLVGWNRSGHDGRFPQLFPADPRLGGDEELKKTLDYVKKLGYRISTHTNTIDCYPLADTFDWNDMAIKRDGQPNQKGHYSGGLAYHVCMIQQLKNTKRDLPPLAALGENGLHFTDVISIETPDDCHNPAHPSTTANGVLYAQKIIEYTRGLFRGFSSEGCMDFALKDLDFGLYVSFGDGFGKKIRPLVDRYLPVWEVTYHGFLLYNPTAPTVNFTIKSPADQLTLLLRGGKPAMYIHSRFRDTTVAKNWMGEVDLTCQSAEEIRFSVSKIKEAAEIYAPLADLQTICIQSYEILENGVHVVTYEDGTVLYGNFNDTEVLWNGNLLKPWGYCRT